MNAHPLQPASRHGLDWTRALAFLARERQSFAERNPASAALAAQASEHLLFGVPLSAGLLLVCWLWHFKLKALVR